MTDFAFSYSIGAMPTNGSETDSLWSYNSVNSLPCVGGTVTLHNTRTQQAMLVQSEVAHALNFCAPFRTLEAHLSHILEAMPPLRETPENARDILNSILDAGFLESGNDAWHRLTHIQNPHKESPARLFILTCDRPAALEKLLNSLAEAPPDTAVDSIWVIDDSKLTASSEQNATIVSELGERFTVPLHHLDEDKQRLLHEHIVGLAPEHNASVSFLIGAPEWRDFASYGRARNLALLLSKNFRALVLDDDIVLQAIAPPLSQTNLKLGTTRDREAQLYSGYDALTKHALNVGESPLTLMLKNVGQTLGGLASASLSGPASLVGWDGSLLSRYDASSPVLLNQCGSWGDPGTEDGSWIFFLSPSSVKSLVTAEGSLESLLAARSSWSGYRGPTLTPYGTISQLTGFDHHHLLPPYFPIGRGEDILFGIMLQRLHPRSLVLNEGWSICHEPIDSRAERGSLGAVGASPGLSTLADWLGQEPEDQWGLSPERRLQVLTDELRRLCEMESHAIEALVGAQLVSKRTSLLSRCQGHLEHLRTLQENNNSQAWSSFLSQTQERLLSELQSIETRPLATALAARHKTDEASLRNMGERFADALSAWPDISAAAVNFTY